jgi:hypothetical protein
VSRWGGNLGNFHVRLSAVLEYQGKLRQVIESSLMDLVLRELEEPERAIRAGLVTHPADGSCVQRFIDGDIRVDSGPATEPRLLKRLCDTKTPWRSLEDSVSYGNLECEPREGIEMSLASCGTVARLGLISSLVG